MRLLPRVSNVCSNMQVIRVALIENLNSSRGKSWSEILARNPSLQVFVVGDDREAVRSCAVSIVLTNAPGEVRAAAALVGSLPLLAIIPEESAEMLAVQLQQEGAGIVLTLETPPSVVLAAIHTLLHVPPAALPGHTSGGEVSASQTKALTSALGVLRDFSQVLGYSLDHRQLTQHFVFKFREVIGANRIAIFVELEDGAMPCVASVGLPTEIKTCFSLSRRDGLGRHIAESSQMLRLRNLRGQTPTEVTIMREMVMLGGQVAVPVSDRERTIGLAVLGGRITGGEFGDEEMLLVYHLLEELGIAVKNSWMHVQVAGNRALLSSVLEGLPIGAVVVGANQHIGFANRAASALLCTNGAPLTWRDLPPVGTTLAQRAMESSAVPAPEIFKFADGRLCRMTAVRLAPASEQTALLLLEDYTAIKSAQLAEIEASNLRLISVIARRFAHEIRNSLVPLSTHAQLFDSEIDQSEFRDSLRRALTKETQRIQRFTDQMLLLGGHETAAKDLAPLDEMVHEAFKAAALLAGEPGTLELKTQTSPLLTCNRARMVAALTEVLLNSLQSSGGGTVQVQIGTEDAQVVIGIKDSGNGFTEESAARGLEPFFSARNTGVGLGLTIADKIVNAHRGTVRIFSRRAGKNADIEFRLPLT